jgi:large subunit ribosomal protein L13
VIDLSSKNFITLVDAENMILGRLASIISKRLIEGEKVFVVNVDKVVVSGNPQSIFEEYKKLLNLRTLRNPRLGPKIHRSPNMIFRRVVAGMLPKDSERGRKALRNLKVFMGFPEEYKHYPVLRFKEADAGNLSGRYVYLIEISKQLGWSGGLHE